MKVKALNPIRAYRELKECTEELALYKKYKEIIFELLDHGRLEEMGFSVDEDANLYLGMDLNPELLMYSETSQESVELRLISEKMKKYNDFLTKEGILDSVKMDYDRVRTDLFYGYILKISFNFKNYSRKKYATSIFHIAAFTFMIVSIIIGIVLIIL